MKTRFTLLYLFVLYILVFVTSCSDEESIAPEDSFSKVYTDDSFDNNFFAIDVVQTADSGYLVLGEYENANVEYRFSPYILKVDPEGEMQWDLKLDAPYQKPIKGMQVSDSAVTFFCMHSTDESTIQMSIDISSQSVTEVETISSLRFPLACTPLGNNQFLILGFDLNESSSVLYMKGSTSWRTEFLNIEDADDLLVPHFNRTGDQLPFFTGEFNGNYYFNGLSNYGFGMCFVDANGDELDGSISGFRYSTSVSSAVHLTGNIFAMSRYDENQNYLMPYISIDPSTDEVADRLGGLEMPQMKDKATTQVQEIEILSQPTVLYGTSTRDNRIMLTGYDASTGLLLGTKYIGFGNPYDLVSVKSTSDGGLIVLASTYITGRFPRIALFKLSEDQAKDIIY